jgi:hypothetical protein
MAKHVESLEELVPAVNRITILWDLSVDSIADAAKNSELESVARSLRIRVQPVAG